MAAGGKGTGWYTVWLVVTLYVGLYIVFVGESWLLRLVETEQQMNAEFYSPQVAEAARDRATRWYTAVFVNTGIVEHSFAPFLPTEGEQRTRGMEDFGEPLFHWFEGRIRSWWTLVWSMFNRVSAAMLWLPILPFMIVPFAVDGWVEREIKKHTFEFSSPVQQRYAMMLIGIIPLLFLIFLALPVAMAPIVVPVMGLGVGVTLQRATANFMKRA